MKEPLLLTFCPTNNTVAKDLGPANMDQSSLRVLGKTILPTDLGPNMRLDTELYEGIVTQTIIEPKVRPGPQMALTVLRGVFFLSICTNITSRWRFI